MSKKSSTPKKIALTAEHERILIKQSFDDAQPGPILHDFETLLKFVSDRAPLKVSGINNLLPLDVLVPLNSQLAHPIRLDLKRPQHKSFSNLFGLYLLLRASGLVYVESRGKTQVLVVDAEAVASWQTLNPTERYFMLLETMMLRAKPEIIGERGSSGLWGTPQHLCLDFFKRFPAGEIDVAGNKATAESLSYFPGFYLLALLEMFGIIAIQDDAPERGKGWRILSIRKTAFGEALFRFLTLQFERDLEIRFNAFSDDEEESHQIGCWQKLFQPYFPEWRSNLTLPTPAAREGMFIFKAAVAKAWRRIAIPGTMDLDDFASVILNAFRFDHDHLYEFIYKDRFGVKRSVHHPMLEEAPFTDEMLVQDLPVRIGDPFIFFFDFGDCWEFDVTLELIEPLTSPLKKAKILEEHGKAPAQYWNDEDEEEWEEDEEEDEEEEEE